jgi:hypothetical protein
MYSGIKIYPHVLSFFLLYLKLFLKNCVLCNDYKEKAVLFKFFKIFIHNYHLEYNSTFGK